MCTKKTTTKEQKTFTVEAFSLFQLFDQYSRERTYFRDFIISIWGKEPYFSGFMHYTCNIGLYLNA